MGFIQLLRCDFPICNFGELHGLSEYDRVLDGQGTERGFEETFAQRQANAKLFHQRPASVKEGIARCVEVIRSKNIGGDEGKVMFEGEFDESLSLL